MILRARLANDLRRLWLQSGQGRMFRVPLSGARWMGRRRITPYRNSVGAVALGGVVAVWGCSAAPKPAATPAPAPASAPSGPLSASGLAPRPLPCETLPATPDSGLDTLFLSVDAPLLRQSLPVGYADQVLAAIYRSMQIPRPLVLPVFIKGEMASGRADVLHPAIAAEVEFTLRDTGAVVGRTVTSSLSDSFDRALADAPRRADSLQLLPPRAGLRSARREVQFFATVLPSRPQGTPAVPLVVVRVPEYVQSHEPEAVGLTDATGSPMQPARDAHTENVVVQVVIDERGQPVISTFRLVEAHYREFARSAAQRLQSASYRPASIGGCAVRALTELQYRFSVAN